MAPTNNTLVRTLLSPVFPVLILLTFLALAAGLRYGMIRQDNHQIRTNLANEAVAMVDHLEPEFTIHAQAINRMAARLQAEPETTEAAWRADARHYLNDFGVYQAIEWIDRAGQPPVLHGGPGLHAGYFRAPEPAGRFNHAGPGSVPDAQRFPWPPVR